MNDNENKLCHLKLMFFESIQVKNSEFYNFHNKAQKITELPFFNERKIVK